MISESIFDQSDEEGYYFNIFKGIVGHRKGADAIPKEKGMIEINGVSKKIIATKGWDMNIEWSDGTCSWPLGKKIIPC